MAASISWSTALLVLIRSQGASIVARGATTGCSRLPAHASHLHGYAQEIFRCMHWLQLHTMRSAATHSCCAKLAAVRVNVEEVKAQ